MQSVSLVVAVLIGVIGVLLGAVIGLFIGRGLAASAAIDPTSGLGVGAAPQLPEEQLEAGTKGLPCDHPPVGGSTTATAAK
jgi:hypothetical protein